MIKYLLFLLSTSTIMLLNYFAFEEVEIEHDIPDYLVAGESYTVNINITKGNISGFAKFQMEVPDGIEIKSIETGASSFTFNEQIAKNIWMSVPTEDEISLSYTFSVGANYQGSGTVSAQFVYIKENERYSVAMKDHPVSIGEEGAVAVAVDEEDAGFVPEMIQSYRSVKDLGNNEFEVNIRVEKDGLEGFAKIQDDLPEGYTATLLVGGESHFTVADSKVKFIWFNVPPENEIEVSYLLKGASDVESGAQITGTFNFIYKDDARFIDLPQEELVFEEAVATVEEEEPVQQEETPPATDVAAGGAAIAAGAGAGEEDPEEEPVVVEPEPEEEEVVATIEEDPVVEVEAPQSDVFYRVQLAAGPNNVKTTYFKNKYSFRSEIYLERHEGWYKYTTGNYEEYRKARDRREEIKAAYNFRGPFVTAYNAGERITVQEALLITKQKWVK